MIELWIWISTMYLCSLAYFVLAGRYHRINPYKSTIPIANAKFMSRLALTNAINYLTFGVIAIVGIYAYPEFLEGAISVLDAWYIVEVFIFWNLRTTALIFLGMRNTKVEI